MKKFLILCLVCLGVFYFTVFAKEKASDATELSFGSLTELFTDYYNDGNYTKYTTINVDTNVKEDVSVHFHTGNIPALERTTVYTPGKLVMTTASDPVGVGYKDSGNDMARFHGSDETIDYKVSNTSVEKYYVTLNDFAKGTTGEACNYGNLDLTKGWIEKDGVYTNTTAAVLDAYRLFTAPMWIATDTNYFDFTHATAEVVDGKLVMTLWVSVSEYGKTLNDELLDNSGTYLVFSQAVVEIPSVKPVIDGVIESSVYGSNYISYTANGQSIKAGNAEIDMYWYEAEDALYLAFDIAGAGAIEDYEDANTTRRAGGTVFLVRNAKGEGTYHRIYAVGGVRVNTLANVAAAGNAYGSGDTAWTSTTQDNVDYAGIKYQANKYSENLYDSFVVEYRLDYADYNVSSSSELQICMGWYDLLGADTVYNKAGTQQKRLTEDLKYQSPDDSYWWTFAEIKANKTERAIRLDGYVDDAYTNYLEYSHVAPKDATDTSVTKVYWYEDTDALYLAFDVTPSQARTLKNSGSGGQGSAGIVFAVANTSTQKGIWHRAFSTNTAYKAVEKVNTDKTFYSCSNSRTDYIRGNEGALVGLSRTSVIATYVIEVRIDYADYGVSDASGLSILLGGIEHKGNQGWSEWLYDAHTSSSYTFASTGDATAAGYVGNVSGSGRYYITFAELKTYSTVVSSGTQELPGVEIK